MPQFNFSLGNDGTIREAGAVLSDSFDEALDAIADQADARIGDHLEIGVAGFPPARYELIRTGRRAKAWKPEGGRLAA